MAIAFRASSGFTDAHTVDESWTSTIPASVATGDIMLMVQSQLSNGIGPPSDDGGGSAWTEINEGSGAYANICYKRAVAGSAGATLTFGKAAVFAFAAFSGCTTGTPYEANTVESNASGNESHASISSLGNGRWLVLGVANTIDDNLCSAQAATDPASVTERADALNATIARGAMIAAAAQTGSGACGTISWSQTNDDTISFALYLVPDAVDLALTSVLGTSAVGTETPTFSSELTQAAAVTGSVGSLALTIAPALTSVLATSAVGDGEVLFVYLPLAGIKIDYWDGAAWIALVGNTYSLDGLNIQYGISGAGPLDVIASVGVCTFTLLNRNPEGQYSPAHASVATGWGVDTPIRVAFSLAQGGDIVKFRGLIQLIDPVAGTYGNKHVLVVANDYMGKLADAMVSEITAQVDQTDAALIQLVYDSIPAASLPPALDIDAAIDTYRYAFDEVGPGDQALTLLMDVLISTSGMLFQRGDGTHEYRNRETRTYTESVDVFTQDDIREVYAPSDKSTTFEGVVIEVPQIEIGVSNEVLAAEVGEDRDPIPDGETVERWLEYRDPLDTATDAVRVAGTSMVQPVATTDYTFNSQADGGGSNLTASVSVTADYFSGTCKLTIVNSSGSLAYRTKLQVRGKAIRRYQPRVVVSGDITGTKVLRIQSPFQGSTSVAQFQADVFQGQYSTTLQRPTELAIFPQQSERLMEHAISREPGDRITIVEPVTGLSADAIIHGISITVKGPVWIEECRWTLAPQSSFLFITPWRWGIAGKSEWGETTVYG